MKFIKLCCLILSFLPRRVHIFFGFFLGSLAFLLVKKRRRITHYNIKTAFPECKHPLFLTWKCFCHFGVCIFDTLLLPWWQTRLKKWLIFPDLSCFHECLEKKQGSILLTAHFGNWEILSTLANQAFPLSGMYQTQKNHFVNELFLWLRSSTGLYLIEKKIAIRDSLRFLNEGKILGTVADQGIGNQTLFFSTSTQFPQGPQRLAKKTGSRVFFTVCVREGLYWKLQVLGEMPTDNDETALQWYANQLESIVRLYPQQYFWMHDLWKVFKK